MDTNGHYDVVRQDRSPGYIRHLKCCHCNFLVGVRDLFRSGDKSGAGAYCRARAKMVKHLHSEHRSQMEAHP